MGHALKSQVTSKRRLEIAERSRRGDERACRSIDAFPRLMRTLRYIYHEISGAARCGPASKELSDLYSSPA